LIFIVLFIGMHNSEIVIDGAYCFHREAIPVLTKLLISLNEWNMRLAIKDSQINSQVRRQLYPFESCMALWSRTCGPRHSAKAVQDLLPRTPMVYPLKGLD
jgi:hypothetical protein